MPKQQHLFDLKQQRKFKSHRWTEAESRELDQTVRDCLPILDHFIDRGYSKNDWWNAVAGALFARIGIMVSGSACRNRYRYMCANYPQTVELFNSINEQEMIEHKQEQESEAVRVVKAMCKMFGLNYNMMLNGSYRNLDLYRWTNAKNNKYKE